MSAQTTNRGLSRRISSLIAATAVAALLLPVTARAQQTIHIPHTVTVSTATYNARVIGIVDAETLLVQRDDQKITLHLYGVHVSGIRTGDTDRARSFLTDQAKDKNVRVEEHIRNWNGSRDAIVTVIPSPTPVQGILPAPEPYDPTGTSADQPHGATLSVAPTGGIEQSLNHLILRGGLAQWDRKTAPAMADFEKAEADARKDSESAAKTAGK